MEKTKKRFAVLLCAEDSEYVKKRYGGYFGVFVSLLGEEGESWDLYRVCQGEFPPDDDHVELATYDGFVISGSCNDAHGNDPWICRLISLLQKLQSMHAKVLGICFGHQILSRALGGRTGRASKGWDVGLTTVNLSPSSGFLASLNIPSSLPVIECHRDEVLELPRGAEVLAWSEKTGIEMFRYGDNMMGIQGHPEYTKDILHQLLNRLLARSLIQVDLANVAKSAVESQEPNREAWQMLCRSFFKGKAWLSLA